MTDTPVIHAPDPLVFHATADEADNPFRPNGLVHVFAELPHLHDETTGEWCERFWQHQLAGPVCGAAITEGAGLTRLRNLQTPNPMDDGHVVSPDVVTCPECARQLAEYGADLTVVQA